MTAMLSCDREWGVAWIFLVQWSCGGREGFVYQINPSLISDTLVTRMPDGAKKLLTKQHNNASYS